ncbi:multicopper oxidase [Bipolaris zeicola 26-R-13]|uniref:laccase n=1 Tax=Cochliobolus carbonum (strain 26-R-13) TaxID=930089 RepID=W6YQ43_COCC2|nr:multicopper oxidase [Bipolaris zeicola 26-R-13]EUC33606.1 multicopper oxidase [Bipolaris zeicola 26-R-13]
MKSIHFLGTVLLGLSHSLANAAAIPNEFPSFAPFTPKRDGLEERQSPASCINVGNTPNTRHCWAPGFTSSTDMYTSWPNTGVVRSYNLRVENTTCNPDGAGSRVCMLINGRYPGPTIVANWGDTIRVTVRNLLQSNGTSFHWHGFRMLNKNIQDGVNGITECAVAPGDFKTYEFQATEYGTTWYHSHFSHQYGDGVVGTVIVNGPATANYDEDLGVMPITDWYYKTAYQAASIAFQNGQAGLGPPVGDNILINGTAKNAAGGGSWNKVTIQAGKRYRLRLVNTAVDTNMLVNLDGHPFQVIATDFVPVNPYNTTHLQIGIGQRYDVVFTANQTAGNYWFRAVADGLCQSRAAREGRAIFTYQGQTVADPTSTTPASPFTACVDPVTTPKIAKDVPSSTFAAQSKTLPVAFGPVAANGNTVLWTINGTSMIIDPGKPTIKYVAENNNSFPQSYNVVQVPSTSASTWTYWVIQQAVGAPPIAHPIHLHGHDSYVLGAGDGQFSSATHFSQLRFTNPPRRDVVQLKGGGWLVLAYPTDNPGAWLMHCHIAFHVGMGLSVQFLERKQEINLPAAGSEWNNNCNNWAAYKAGTTDVWPQDDSGLKKRWPPLIEGRSTFRLD